MSQRKRSVAPLTPSDPGRVVKLDPRSSDYPAQMAPAPATVEHAFPVVRGAGGDLDLVLDQGEVRACTGTAFGHLLMCEPFGAKLRQPINIADALNIYALGTAIDDEKEWWPRTDRGLSLLDGAKACEDLGFISGYQWAFNLEHLLRAMVYKPFIVGINWYADMSKPDNQGFIHPTGVLKGGHALTTLGANIEEGYITLLNSWGADWGANGACRISFEDLDALFKQDGEAITVTAITLQRPNPLI